MRTVIVAPRPDHYQRHMVPSFFSRFSRRLQTVDDLAGFLRDQSMRVAQGAILTYLKGRMGTSWPRHFEDPGFAAQIEAAQRQGFLMCLADLTIFAVAQAGIPGELRDGLSKRLFDVASDRAEKTAIESRLSEVQGEGDDEIFGPSLRKLITVTPVSDAFKTADQAAFANALALRWADVRERFHRQADIDQLTQALRELATASPIH